jgi:putative DNA methylase
MGGQVRPTSGDENVGEKVATKSPGAARKPPRQAEARPTPWLRISVRLFSIVETYVLGRVAQAIRLRSEFPMPEYHRRLPHFHPEDCYLFLTWRLWGSLPARMRSDGYRTHGHAFAATDAVADRLTSGPLWLQDPRIASLVSHSVLMGARERRFYHLRAWVVMPNHVHLLILPLVPVPMLMRWLKGSTARRANQLLNRTGQRF